MHHRKVVVSTPQCERAKVNDLTGHNRESEPVFEPLCIATNVIEVASLQANRHLVLVLVTRNCSPRGLASLRRWLEGSAKEGAVVLPWKYEVPLERLLPPTTMGRTNRVETETNGPTT